MKREYRKPEIMFEDFTLSTNIAGDCEVKTNTASKGDCAYGEDTDFGVAIFLSTISDCIYQQAEGEFNSICYHTFEGNSLFNS